MNSSEIDPTRAVLSKEKIEQKFKDILKSNGINDEVSEVIMKDAGLKGEGFASETYLVTVKFDNPSLKNLNLFVKTETTNASYNEMLTDSKLFLKESDFFTRYIPAVTDFCKSKGKEELVEIYPKCYYGDTRLIVLENLVLDKGYELLDKTELQDFTAASLALTTLAKHHAVSFAFMNDVGGAEAFLEMFPTFDFEGFLRLRPMMELTMESTILTLIKILEKSEVEGKEDAIEILKTKIGKTWEDGVNAIKDDPETDTILLLNHGDFWNNNMMFLRDKETKELIGHKAIDLQLVRYGCPAYDLVYFMFSSVKPELRRERLKDLLNVYLDVLNSTTEQLGHPANMTFEELFLSFRRHIDFGFLFFGILVAPKASYAALQEFDISKIEANDFGTVYNDLVSKWIEANPEASLEDANGIVDLVMEYKSLRLNS